MAIDTGNLSHELKLFYHQYRKRLVIEKLKKAIEEGKIVIPHSMESEEMQLSSDSSLAFSLAISHPD